MQTDARMPAPARAALGLLVGPMAVALLTQRWMRHAPRARAWRRLAWCRCPCSHLVLLMICASNSHGTGTRQPSAARRAAGLPAVSLLIAGVLARSASGG